MPLTPKIRILAITVFLVASLLVAVALIIGTLRGVDVRKAAQIGNVKGLVGPLTATSQEQETTRFYELAYGQKLVFDRLGASFIVARDSVARGKIVVTLGGESFRVDAEDASFLEIEVDRYTLKIITTDVNSVLIEVNDPQGLFEVHKGSRLSGEIS